MAKTKTITAYFMRVDEKTGKIYQGYLGEIKDTLKAYQRYVGFGRSGMRIETVTFSGNLVLICNEFSKIYHYPPNRTWIGKYEDINDVIMGNALVVRRAGEEFASVEPSDVQTIREHLVPVESLLNGRVALVLDEDSLPKYEEDSNADVVK